MQVKEQAKKRNGVIDFWRIVFCCMILFWHGRNLGGSGAGFLCAQAGYIAVEFFYLVAGYFMAASAEKMREVSIENLGPETVAFIFRKIKSILPAYAVAVCFSFARIVVINEMSFYVAVRTLCLGIWDILFLRASGIGTYGIVRATWFLSAMYIAMMALYPLLRKYKKNFTYIIAPLISITLLGWLSKTYGNLNQYVAEFSIVYSGVLRAIAEISIGCICYEAAQRLRCYHLSTPVKCLISILQVAGYLSVIACATKLPVKQFDFVMLLVLAVSVTLTCSEQGLLADKFSSPVFTFLGKMSMIIYLNHMWVKDSITGLLPQSIGNSGLMGIFIIAVFTVGLCCIMLEKGLSILWLRLGNTVRRWFVRSTDNKDTVV